MTRRELLATPALIVQNPPAVPEYQIGAYYFPNYHVDPRNERTHGRGWTEWELVKHALPRYEGHRQPRKPLWGYEDESNPRVFEKKIDVAAKHGLNHFIFDYYWYNDGPYLNRCLDRGYLGSSNHQKVKFALMWANHDWLDIHPARAGVRAPLLYPGALTRDAWDWMTDNIVTRYFAHPSYWRPGGLPYFSIYELYKFVDSMGGTEEAAAALQQLRNKAGRIHINAVVWGVKLLPSETTITNPNQMLKILGIDSVTSYVWIHHFPLTTFPSEPYERAAQFMYSYWRKAAADFNIPYHPNVTMGWDASPRTCQSDTFEDRGYPFMPMLTGNTPQAFRRALQECKNFLDTQRNTLKICNINAWNEWTEGSYLEPDTEYGMGYLEAIRDTFSS